MKASLLNQQLVPLYSQENKCFIMKVLKKRMIKKNLLTDVLMVLLLVTALAILVIIL